MIAALMRRLGHPPPFALPEDDRAAGADDAVLTAFNPYGRRPFAEVVEHGYLEVESEVPARWVDAHIERLGGWRLAPTALVTQLKTLTAEAAQQNLATLQLIPRRQQRHLNASLLFLGDSPTVLLNPVDASSAGVLDGQQVIVRSSRGQLVGTARVDARIRPGVVSVPHGHEHANVNWLTDSHKVDSITGMARYSGLDVTVHPVASDIHPSDAEA